MKSLQLEPTFRPRDVLGDKPLDIFPQVVVAQPGDGTRYVLLVTPVVDEEAAKVLGIRPGSWVVSHAPGAGRYSGSMFIAPGSLVSDSYVAEKLDVSPHTAGVLAALLRSLLDAKPGAHKCAPPDCPGRTSKASDSPHPAPCAPTLRLVDEEIDRE